jgi:Tfp pilus assembly protein PilF
MHFLSKYSENMKKGALAVGLIVGVGMGAGCHHEAALAPNAVDSGDAAQAAARITEGDQHYQNREDLGKARLAVASLRQAVTADYGSYEAAWKLSRASFYVGDHTRNGDEADEMFRTGVEAGKAAVKLQNDKPEGHFWLGANYGGEAKRSTLASLSSVQDIKNEMETVIRLNESFQGGSAYLALGRLYLEAPKVLGGDVGKATEYLKKGLTISPNNGLMKYYLAESYVSSNRDAEAKKLVAEIMEMTPDPQYQAEHKDALEKANKLKQKLG